MFGKAFSAVKLSSPVESISDADKFVASAWRVTPEQWQALTDSERTHKRDHVLVSPMFTNN